MILGKYRAKELGLGDGQGHLSWNWRMCRRSLGKRGGGRGVNIIDRDPKCFGRTKESQRGRGGE